MKKIISLLTVFCLMFSTANADEGQENISVEVEEKILTKDVDYTLTYYDNVKVGKATVVVTFIGNYAGEKEQTFNIVKRKASSSSKKEDMQEEIQEDNVAVDNSVSIHKAYISGYENGLFKPDEYITRAETASMLYRILDVEETGTVKEFSDIEKNSWYETAVNAMSASGIVNGYEDNTFRPDKEITRAEFVTMLMQNSGVLKFDSVPFGDVTDDMWSSDYIYSAYKSGYIDGYEDGTFRPDKYITRAEAVKIINCALGRLDFSNEENPFVDVAKSHWAYKHILEAVEHTEK